MIFITQEDEIKLHKMQSLYFYMPNVLYNKKIIIAIKEAEKKYNIDFFAIDASYFKGLCRRFDITAIPTIIILSDGKEIKRISGLVSTNALSDIYS